MKRQLVAAATLALAVGAISVGGQASAEVLFDQAINYTSITTGGDGGPYSNTFTQIFANSFSLSSGGSFNQVIWDGGTYDGLPYSSAFAVIIYQDDGGTTGNALYSLSVGPTITTIGPDDGYGQPLQQFTANISPFTAEPGATYWLSVSDYGVDNFVWSPSLNYEDADVSFNGYSGPWAAYDLYPRDSEAFELVSSIVGVPEPATWALMLIGVVGAGCHLRFSRRREAVKTI